MYHVIPYHVLTHYMFYYAPSLPKPQTFLLTLYRSVNGLQLGACTKCQHGASGWYSENSNEMCSQNIYVSSVFAKTEGKGKKNNRWSQIAGRQSSVLFNNSLYNTALAITYQIYCSNNIKTSPLHIF